MSAGGRAAPAARLSGVVKRFGATTALDAVDFDVRPGEIHGLLGENGAGKTTLARVAAGVLRPDAGSIEVCGAPLRPGSPGEARARGVAMVHQHFSLVPRFTGFENAALFNAGAWTRRGLRRRGWRKRVETRAEELGLAARLDEPVGALSVVERQRVEILKALAGETRALFLDEPTAVLAPQEVAGLFAVLRRVARAGTGIVLVAHKLDEVLGIADRVTVLRRGRRVMTARAQEVTARQAAEAMVGRAAASLRHGSAPKRAAAAPHPNAPTVASLQDVSVAPRRGAAPLRNVTMSVRRGEIFGVAGVGGNGQRALAEVLAGMRQPDSGAATVPTETGWIPQDRAGEGLVNKFTITENVALALHGSRDCRRGPLLDWAAAEARATALTRDLDIRAESPRATAASLSGGNQQRLVAGREFLRGGDLLVAESPTRGLDVRATAAVRARIAALAATGPRPPGIVLISADLDEVLELSDTIAVMVRGRLVPVPRGVRDPAAIGELMLSARRERPAQTAGNAAP